MDNRLRFLYRDMTELWGTRVERHKPGNGKEPRKRGRGCIGKSVQRNPKPRREPNYE